MFHIWRTASSRSFDWCAARRRRLQAAGASGAGRRAGRLLRAARPSGRARDILHHSMLALEPSMALASFSLVAYSCRCMRQLRWWRAAAMLAPSGGRLHLHACSIRRPCGGASRHAPGLSLCPSEDMGLRVQRRLLLVEVHLRFSNVYSRPTRVRRASQVPQGRVPRGVHGKAR